MSATETNPTLCCAQFYEQDWVQTLLGDSFHPGGTQLSRRLVASLCLPPDARVLDVACGVGTTTLLMAREFRLDPVGVDFSEMNLAKARDRSAADPPVLVEFVPGTAEALPFGDGLFDAVVCECAVSTFVDQPRVMAEFARVLKPGGVVGISDMIVEGPLPERVAGLLAPWTCLRGARSVLDNQKLFLNAGLRVLQYADESDSLRDMILQIKQKLVSAALAKAVGAVPGLAHLDVRELRNLLAEASDLVTAGTLQYARMVFARGKPTHPPREPEVTCDPATGCCDVERSRE